MHCSPPGSSVHGDSPGKNTGVSCHALLQGIFPTRGSNPGLPHCRWILYQPSHQGSPIITRLLCPWDFPGKNTGVDCHFLLPCMKVKSEYFGHLVGRADSLEKTLMLGKIEGRRRGRQRTRWLDRITNSMDNTLSKL